MAYVIPTVGAEGFYTLKAPFDSKIAVDEQYKCQGVRCLGDWLALNEDPLNNIYLYYGLTETDFETDLAENMFIVSLQSQNGQFLYVPARYFITYPIQNGVVYQTMILGVSIGATPVDTDLDPLITKISNVVYESFGIKPNITPVVASKKILVSRDDHDRIETARLQRASLKMTDYGRYLAALEENQVLRDKVQALEQYIIDKNN